MSEGRPLPAAPRRLARSPWPDANAFVPERLHRPLVHLVVALKTSGGT